MADLQKTTLGGGCFWCTEAIYQDIIGVEQVVSGYANGQKENPTYREVCTGRTGHNEVVQITFDPEVISYAELLEIFWRVHDPTTLNRQGADVGTQYRSGIYYTSDEQREIAEQSKREADASDLYRNAIVTEIEPLQNFYPAEEYHQDYYKQNPNQGYCRAVIDPKVRKFRKSYANRLKGAVAA